MKLLALHTLRTCTTDLGYECMSFDRFWVVYSVTTYLWESMRGSWGHPFLVDVVVNHDRSSRRSDALLWAFVAHLARKTCNPYSVGSVKNTQTPTFLRLTGNDSSQPFRMISLAFKIHRKSTAWNSCISLDFSTFGFTPLCDESK